MLVNPHIVGYIYFVLLVKPTVLDLPIFVVFFHTLWIIFSAGQVLSTRVSHRVFRVSSLKQTKPYMIF